MCLKETTTQPKDRKGNAYIYVKKIDNNNQALGTADKDIQCNGYTM